MACGRDKPVNLVSAARQGPSGSRAGLRNFAPAGILSRAESFTRQLQAELAEAARCQAIATAHIPKCHHHGTTQEPKRKTALARSSRVEGRSVSRAIWKLGSVFNIAGLCQNLLGRSLDHCPACPLPRHDREKHCALFEVAPQCRREDFSALSHHPMRAVPSSPTQSCFFSRRSGVEHGRGDSRPMSRGLWPTCNPVGHAR